MPAWARDAQQLYGIHWWGFSGSTPVDQTPKALFDLPTYSMWDMETVVTNSDVWWQASWFKPLYQAIYPLNATVITRADYTWQDCVPSPTDSNYASWPNTYVTNVVNTLHDYSHIYIVGNEPNLTVSSWPSGQITPAGYATVYKNVRNAVHASGNVGAPGQHLVLLAGPSPGGAEGVRWMEGNQYLGQVLDNLTPADVDGFAIHAYGWDVNGFSNDYKAQLRVIDQKGFGSKPVWITEFNRYTTDDNDEQNTAQFARDAFSNVDTWNQTPGAHNIVGMTWFIYDGDNQAGGGWNGYSIEYWKTHGFPYGDPRDLYTAFEQTVDLRYAAGIYGCRPLTAWTEDFNDGVIDQTLPDPCWKTSVESGGAISETGGYLKMTGTSGQASFVKAYNDTNLVYDNFVLSTKVYLANATSTNGDESNAEIRFRTDGNGTGYSLSFKALDSPNVINLRRDDTWAVVQSKEIQRNLPSGSTFYVRIECNGTRIKIKIGTTAGGSDVANWDFTDSTFTAKGGIWLAAYHITDARFDYVNLSPLPSGSSAGVTGVVKDSLGNAIVGATVSTTNGAYTTTTGTGGAYTITGMDPGTYDLTASKTNYTSGSAANVAVVADAVTSVSQITITDNTKPTTPVITDAGAYQTVSDSIAFSWTCSDPESGIAEYRTAISTNAAGSSLIPNGGWVSAGTATSTTRTGLSLANGQTYYCLVKARNPLNIFSNQGNSDGVKIAKLVPNVAKAKAENNTIMVALNGVVVTANLSDCLYVEDWDRTSGIKIGATGYAEGTLVDLAGFITTSGGERQISGYSIIPGTAGNDRDPLGMGNTFLGGGSLNGLTLGITDGVGVNTIGLLVTTWGKVTDRQTGYFVIDDGSKIGLKVSVPAEVTCPPMGTVVVVTGISTVESNGTVTRLLRARKPSDIR